MVEYMYGIVSMSVSAAHTRLAQKWMQNKDQPIDQ